MEVLLSWHLLRDSIHLKFQNRLVVPYMATFEYSYAVSCIRTNIATVFE